MLSRAPTWAQWNKPLPRPARANVPEAS